VLPDGTVVRGGDVLIRGAAVINSAGKIGPAGLDGTPITPTAWLSHPNNVNDFFETGVTTNNNVSLSGGSENSMFRLSYTRMKSNGIIPNVDLERNSVALNGGYSITNKFSISANLNYVKSLAPHRPGLGYGSENPMYVFAWYGRSINTNALRDYWQRGYEGVAQYNYNYAWHDNPYLNMFENTNSSDKNRVLGNITANYEFTDELSLMLRTGQDFFIDNRVSKRVFTTQRFPFGMFREDDEFFQERNSDFLLTYDKDISTDWAFTISAGGNIMNQQRRFTSSIANELAVPNVYSLANAKTPVQSSQFDTEKEIHSLYGMAQIAFLNSIFLDVTTRSDWSSAFYSTNPLVPNKGNYTYPAVSLSAVVSDLVSMPTAFSYLKFRGGYAQVGNDTQPFSLVNVYTFQTPYNNKPALSEQSVLNNTGLVPERQKSWEFGTDIKLFGNRIGLDVTYYNTENENQIIRIPVTKSSGYEQAIVNGGLIRTFGIEASLYAQPVRLNNGLTWDVQVNYTKNDSEIKEVLPGLLDSYTYTATTVYSNTEAQVFANAVKGGRMGDIYGTGFQKDPDGNIIFNGGVPVPSNELRKLGNYNPDFMLGLFNKVAFKNISLSFLFDWRQGGVVVSRMTSISNNAGTLDQTVRGRDDLYGYEGGAIFDSEGNPLDPNTAVGVIGDGVINVGSAENPVYQANNVVISSQTYFNRFYARTHEESNLFDATFVKFRELTLMYELPKSLLSNTFLREVSIGFIARNLALWTKQDHFDPETLTRENNGLAVPGVEEMAYPSNRGFGFNLNAKF
jgi:outer membrane receptor protein involved in Fe transport